MTANAFSEKPGARLPPNYALKGGGEITQEAFMSRNLSTSSPTAAAAERKSIAPPPNSGPPPALDQISTRWPLITDAAQFVMRYLPAIRHYLEALLKNCHDAEDATQEFLLRGLLRGFLRTNELRGRFRDYLKTAVRNAALTHLHHKKALREVGCGQLHLPASSAGPSEGEQNWLAQWRRCILDRAWRALTNHQLRSPGNLFYTVLRFTAEYPQEDSTALADQTSRFIGRPLRADAFRKQLSRARRLFAQLIVFEVRQTLEEPTPENIDEELSVLGLRDHVRRFLTADAE
jgi:RNA polymerase sigma-70 factor (ECF subfamily)